MPSVNVASKALYFQDVIGQPIDVLKEVVAFAGLPWNAAKEATAEAAVVAQRLRKKKMGGKIAYDMEAFELIRRPKVCNGTLSSTSKANLSSALQLPVPA